MATSLTAIKQRYSYQRHKCLCFEMTKKTMFNSQKFAQTITISVSKIWLVMPPILTTRRIKLRVCRILLNEEVGCLRI